MGTILNQYGKLIDGSVKKYNRPQFQFPKATDFDNCVSEYDSQTLIAKSRKLYSNTPYVRAIIQQKAMFSTKNGWNPQIQTDNKEWEKVAMDHLDKFYRVAGMNGMDMNTLIYNMGVAIDRDGDFFAALVTSKQGFPMIQVIPSHRVATPKNAVDGKLVTGTFKGYNVVKGIILNAYSREIGICVTGDKADGSQDKQIASEDYIHIFEQDFAESVRGTPMASHIIQTISDMEESIQRELTSMLLHSSVSLIENLEPADDDTNFTNSTGYNSFDEYKDGQIKVYRGGPDSKLTPFQSERPSPNWREFHGMLLRQICVSCNWSESLLDGKGETSVQNRINLRVAELTVSDRIALLTPHVKRIVTWVLAKAIKDGILPQSADWYKVTFSRPPFITSDISKMENSTRENLKVGITTLKQICDESGRSEDQHLEEYYEGKAKALLAKQRAEEKYNVTLPGDELTSLN